jgi:hypothetical protein
MHSFNTSLTDLKTISVPLFSLADNEPTATVEVARKAPISSYSPTAEYNKMLTRQRTLPVQIDTTIFRVLPKHMRKRIKSAGVMKK